jgi:hypothetical protein
MCRLTYVTQFSGLVIIRLECISLVYPECTQRPRNRRAATYLVLRMCRVFAMLCCELDVWQQCQCVYVHIMCHVTLHIPIHFVCCSPYVDFSSTL